MTRTELRLLIRTFTKRKNQLLKARDVIQKKIERSPHHSIGAECKKTYIQGQIDEVSWIIEAMQSVDTN